MFFNCHQAVDEEVGEEAAGGVAVEEEGEVAAEAVDEEGEAEVETKQRFRAEMEFDVVETINTGSTLFDFLFLPFLVTWLQ